MNVARRQNMTAQDGGRMSKILPAGTPAPDFSLRVTPDQTLSLKELRGRPVILAFLPS
jgi:peroxiredoxin